LRWMRYYYYYYYLLCGGMKLSMSWLHDYRRVDVVIFTSSSVHTFASAGLQNRWILSMYSVEVLLHWSRRLTNHIAIEFYGAISILVTADSQKHCPHICGARCHQQPPVSLYQLPKRSKRPMTLPVVTNKVHTSVPKKQIKITKIRNSGHCPLYQKIFSANFLRRLIDWASMVLRLHQHNI